LIVHLMHMYIRTPTGSPLAVLADSDVTLMRQSWFTVLRGIAGVCDLVLGA
jgi:hypothetical protein